MNFEKIEQAYTYLLENVQSIQNELATSFYDALVEQKPTFKGASIKQGRMAQGLSVSLYEGRTDRALAS